MRKMYIVMTFCVGIIFLPDLLRAAPTADASDSQSGPLKVAGYKNAKWGMSPSKTKVALKLKVIEEAPNVIWFQADGKKQLKCDFLNGKLYAVTYHVEQEESASDIEEALIKKYGQPTNRKESEIPLIGLYLIVKWDDGISSIMLTARNGRATGVVYENHKMSQEANKASESQKLQQKEKRKKAMGDNL